MKKCLVLIILLMVGNVFAASIYPTSTSVNWADDTSWTTGVVPPLTASNELKILSTSSSDPQGYVVTVNSYIGNYTTSKFVMARAGTIVIADGAYIGNGREINVGDAGTSSTGSDDGYLVQTGGTLEITASGKLQLGYKAHAVDNPDTGAKGGTYTISGGTLTGATGRVYVGCASAAGSYGKFVVDGAGGTITIGGNMYVANASSTSSSNEGNATVEFKLDASGNVSKIQVGSLIVDSQATEAAVADLLVTVTGADKRHTAYREYEF
jgi:hypothetical protein